MFPIIADSDKSNSSEDNCIIVDRNSQEQILDLFVFISVVIFGVLLMRTVRKEIYQRQRLSELTEQLKQVDIKKDEFLNVVAHELRAPMTAIKGYISMLMDGDTGQMNEEAMEYLNMVFKSNDRLIRLVNNLLNVSRIEEGRQVYNMAEISLLGVIGTNFDEFKFTADEKHLQLKLDAATPLSDKVYVDTDRIYEVVANFISNAIKYTDQGSVTIRVTNPTTDKIRVEVTDTGRGINELDQKRLFQKYYRAEEAVQRTVGTGLGLYVSKLLVEKFGGTLGLTSTVGKGSTFWFELPLVKTSEERPNILV